MSKKFILYKYDPQGNTFIYISSLTISSIEFTPSTAYAKRYSALFAFALGLLYNLSWINEKHTTP